MYTRAQFDVNAALTAINRGRFVPAGDPGAA